MVDLTMVYGRYNYSIHGINQRSHHWGGTSCVFKIPNPKPCAVERSGPSAFSGTPRLASGKWNKHWPGPGMDMGKTNI